MDIRNSITIASAFAAMTIATGAVSASTLEEVQARGHLRCGVSQGLPGFANPGPDGNLTGFDVDFCRAISAAILGDADAVRYRLLSAKERFTALQTGEVDILSRNTTWTMDRDTALGLSFSVITYYDGQGFLVRSDTDFETVEDWAGVAVCVNMGSTTELNVADYFRANGLAGEYELVTFEKSDEAVAAYDAGRCDVYTTDRSGLYSERLKLDNPAEHKILPAVISKEPLGPVVREGDVEWLNIVKWVHFAMVNAEELGVTSANAEDLASNANSPEIRRLLGLEGDFGPALGLPQQWAVHLLQQVGNYGEVFERNLGSATPLGIARGLNALWTEGGLQYAPPIR